MRLDRLLQSQGFGTRRECQSLIARGDVRIAGETLDDPGHELDPAGLVFEVCGERWPYHEKVVLMMHKPANTECSRAPRHYPGVLAGLPRPLFNRGVQTVGRLDADTTGLLLVTDDGPFIHRITSPKHKVPKVYRVVTKHPIDDGALARLKAGVVLDDDPAPVAALAIARRDPLCFDMTLGEGKYHQVKRMVAAVGNRVEALSRIAIGGLQLPASLAPGQWRYLDEAEQASLWAFDQA